MRLIIKAFKWIIICTIMMIFGGVAVAVCFVAFRADEVARTGNPTMPVSNPNRTREERNSCSAGCIFEFARETTAHCPTRGKSLWEIYACNRPFKERMDQCHSACGCDPSKEGHGDICE